MDIHERLETTLGDRYRVERRLGEGGMAVVFIARDRKHGRLVAIKVLRPELAAALGTDRFLREIEIAAQLNHPNILALHDSGEADGLLYFVMPYVEGESLRERLRREGPMPVAEGIAVAREIGSALDYAHSRVLVHRDVKPENVLFQAGHALVCDFGIAKAASKARDGLTRTGMAVGTVAYMSPEQATGEADIDGRTDVYAMGRVVYEMLAGEGPLTSAFRRRRASSRPSSARRPSSRSRGIDGVAVRVGSCGGRWPPSGRSASQTSSSVERVTLTRPSRSHWTSTFHARQQTGQSST